MIYKLQTGGVIKLQNAGSVPQVDNTRVSKPLMEYQKSTAEQDHNALVKWNLEHPNDKVYRIEDLIQKENEANPSWVKKIADTEIEVPVTAPAVGWNGTSFYSQVPKVKSTVGKELGYTMGLLTAPALLSEFGTYGLIGGGLRLGAGSAAAAGASYVGGKAGDWLDNKLGANWIGDTNRLVLPFITFPAGMKGASSALRSAAGHGITMGMPQETFNALRSSYFTNRFNKINHLKIIPNKGWDNFSNLDVYKDTFYNHPAIETTEPVTDVPNIPGIKVGNPKDIAKLRVSPSSAMETGYIDFFDESKPFRRDLRKAYDIVRDGTSYHFGHPLEEGVIYRTRDGYEFLEYPRGSNTRYYTGKIKTEGYTPTLVHEGEPNMKGTMQLPRPDPFKRNSEDYLWWQRNSPWVRYTKGKTVRINDAIPTKAAWGSDHTSPIRLSGSFDLSDPNLNATMMEYNPLTKAWARVKYQFPKVTVSEPYARLSRDGKIINEARSFSINDDPFNTFQLIKDIEPHQYSVHFKTLGRHALSEPQKQMLFQAVADAIPGGSKLSTWGSVSKGGLAGLKRFEGLGFKPSLQTRTLGLKAQPAQGETLPFGEIVGDKVEVPILYKPRDVVAGSRPISIAEKAGIPKGDRGLFDWNKIELLRPRFNKWADYYGYDQIPESVGLEDAVNIMKNVFKRHNTFFRGVHKPDLPEDVANIENLFGKDYNLDDVYKYVATHGRPGDNAVFISPLSNAGIYGSTGKTAIVRRRFKLGKNPETWLHDADFDIRFGGSPEAIKVAQEKNTFTFPWSQRGHGTVENELLAPDGTINFIDFVPQNASTSYFDLNGSLNKYLGYKSFHDVYGFGDYNIFTDVPIEKPKFKQGGKI